MRIRGFRRIGSGALLLGLLACLSCNPRKPDSPAPAIFRYNESKGITSLDPAFARNQTNIWPVAQLFNGLVELDEHLRVIPAIARSWTIGPDRKTYTFFLRTDVFFHDHPHFPNGKGRHVIARDFLYSLNRISDPEISSPGAWIFRNLKRTRENDFTGIQVLNDSCLTITLKEPFPAFLSLLSMPYASVVPREVVEYYKKDFRSHPVGTGPFRFKRWKEGEKLVLLKNPNYFEKDSLGNPLPYLDGIAITFFADKQSEFLEFLKGRIDFLSGLHPSYRDELTSRSGQLRAMYSQRIQMITGPYLNTEYLGFSMKPQPDEVNNPLHIKEIRQAINYGFDRAKMIRYLRNNLALPAVHGFVPPGMPAYPFDEVKGFAYRPDLCQDLLVKAGYPSGKGLPVITLTTTSGYLDLCEFIQQQLQESGIRIRLEVGTGGSFLDMVANGKLPFFRGSWVADYPDPENYLSLFYSPNRSPEGPNYTRFRNNEFDRLYQQSQAEENDARRAELYSAMDRIILEEAPVVPLYYDKVVRFASRNIKGLESNPLNLLVLKKVRKTESHDPNRR